MSLKDHNRDVIIIANMRTASSFLVGSLARHEEIHADGWEILLPGSSYREAGDSDIDVMEKFYNSSEKVCCAKITYAQVNASVLNYVIDHNFKVIHLTRNNTDFIPERTSNRICDFIGVERAKLSCDRRKTNVWPISKVVKNWDEVKSLISTSKFSEMLDEVR